MSRTAQIACVLIFIALMVAIHQGFLSLQNYFSSDFPVGFIAGAVFAFGIFTLIQKLEAGKASSSIEPAVQKKRSRDFLDL